MIIIGIVIFVLLIGVYMGLPLWAKLIILALNSVFPDPIPILDEVLMVVGVIGDIIRLCKIMLIIEWIRKHKILTLCIVVIFILLMSFIFSSSLA